MELMTNNNVVIADIEITRDSEGRYNLNALHRASGLDPNKAPAQWLRNGGTQDIIKEIVDMQICTSPINAIKGGFNQGTYVHELLAVSYAGWISAAFQLKVNQAFLDSRKPKQIAIPQTLSEALQLAADQAKQLELQAPKVNYFDKVVERENLLNATQVGQKLKLSAVKMNRYLDEMKVYNRSIKRGRAFQQWFIDKGYGVMRQTELGYAQPMFTLSGEAWIVEVLTAEGVA